MWAIVPLKSLEAAKQRLARVLSPEERRDLMLAMARDVLDALARSQRLTGVLIVSRTTEADALAQAFSTERFAESPDADLPTALTQAGTYLTQHLGARGVMVIPADVPLIQAAEIDDLLAGHDLDAPGAVTVVPDGENSGTNCLMLSPPDVIGFVFDGKSFKPHVDAAFAKGLTPRVVPMRGFALDIDTADDLRALLASGRTTQTGTFLEKSGIAERLADIDNGEPDRSP
ncbi:MAG: 2-phospho-L-lactate guanylyltransferase [Pseudomonadota bacterium]